MKLSLFYITLALITAASMCGCGNDVDDIISLTEEDNGRTITFQEGEVFEVVLEEDPASGCRWEIKIIDTSVILGKGKPEFRPYSGADGTGGERFFRFDAYGQGGTLLYMAYNKNREREARPIKVFKVKIEVVR